MLSLIVEKASKHGVASGIGVGFSVALLAVLALLIPAFCKRGLAAEDNKGKRSDLKSPRFQANPPRSASSGPLH